MELNMPGWIVSPLSWKSHITAPQQRAAKIENCLASGGKGLPDAGAAPEYEVFARAMNDATTREHTYNTICSGLAEGRVHVTNAIKEDAPAR